MPLLYNLFPDKPLANMEPDLWGIKKAANTKYILFLLASLISSNISAQHTESVFYDNSKQLFFVETWNKNHTRAHFSFFYEDGKLKADGYKKKDRKYRKHEMPDSFFTAYSPGGIVIQEMKMNADSVIVYTYNEDAILRGKIWAGDHYSYEEQYYLNGNKMIRFECRLADTLNYFKDYYYYPAKWIITNKNLQWPEPLFPIHYGTSGNDGVSVPNTFKIYFYGSTQLPEPKSACSSMTYYPDGKLMTMATDAWNRDRVKRYSHNGNENFDTTQAFYPNGRPSELTYPINQKEAYIHCKWHENGNPSLKTYCKYSLLNDDTSKTIAALKDAVNRAYAKGLTEISFYQNGLLSSQHTLFITAKYDSTGILAEEMIDNRYPGNSVLNTTRMLHTGTFKEGMRDGEWKAFYSNDTNKLCYLVNYKNGLLYGDAIVYDSMGKIMLQCFIKDGYYDGPLIKLNNGDTTEKGNYKNGLQDGIWYYYRSGKIVRADSFNYLSKNLFNCTLLSYHTDPYYKETERIYTSDENYTEIFYYPNGNKRFETEVKANTRFTKSYDEHGNLKGK